MRSARSLTDQRRAATRGRTIPDAVPLAPRPERPRSRLDTSERMRAYPAAGLRPRRLRGSPARIWTKVALVLADAGAMILAMAVAGSWTPPAWIYAGGALVSLAISGAYRPRISLHLLDELPSLLQRLAVPAVLLVPLALAGLERAVYVQVLLTIAGLISARALTYAAVRRARRRGRLHETTVIVGAGGLAVTLARLMAEHPEHGLEPIGFIDNLSEENLLPLPCLGRVEELETALPPTSTSSTWWWPTAGSGRLTG